jgi:catechol 2,3-dioxygenase-like lactoylglutathione lyase family enzyme
MDRLHHVAITVPSIADAVTWYCRKFECETVYQDETWALLQFENIALALVSPDQHPPHFAIERDDAGLYGLLNKHRDGTASAYLSDPWGNTVEILRTRTPE